MATQKQLKAAEKIVENHGNVSRGMLAAGYSEATAKNPKNLTQSKGFNSIVEEMQHELGGIDVTPKRLARVIKQGLAAKQPYTIVTIEKTAGEKPVVKKKTVEKADHKVRHQFLDTALKIMGAYPQEDKSPTTLILAQFKAMSAEYMEEPNRADTTQEAEVINPVPLTTEVGGT